MLPTDGRFDCKGLRGLFLSRLPLIVAPLAVFPRRRLLLAAATRVARFRFPLFLARDRGFALARGFLDLFDDRAAFAAEERLPRGAVLEAVFFFDFFFGLLARRLLLPAVVLVLELLDRDRTFMTRPSPRIMMLRVKQQEKVAVP
jgi:hypothetical protein